MLNGLALGVHFLGLLAAAEEADLAFDAANGIGLLLARVGEFEGGIGQPYLNLRRGKILALAGGAVPGVPDKGGVVVLAVEVQLLAVPEGGGNAVFQLHLFILVRHLDVLHHRQHCAGRDRRTGLGQHRSRQHARRQQPAGQSRSQPAFLVQTCIALDFHPWNIPVEPMRKRRPRKWPMA